MTTQPQIIQSPETLQANELFTSIYGRTYGNPTVFSNEQGLDHLVMSSRYKNNSNVQVIVHSFGELSTLILFDPDTQTIAAQRNGVNFSSDEILELLSSIDIYLNQTPG